MATGGRQSVYKEDDIVDEYLLNQISKWILYNRLGALARDLGISEAEFSGIVIAMRQPEDQIFKILYKWHTRNTLTVKDLITSIVGWNQSGYLDSGAWDHIRSKIDGVAYPSNIEALRLTPHHGSPLPLQLAFMVVTPLTPAQTEAEGERIVETPADSGISYMVEQPDSVTNNPNLTVPSQTEPLKMQPSQAVTPHLDVPDSVLEGQTSAAYFPSSQTNAEFHHFQQQSSFPVNYPHTGFFQGYHQQSFPESEHTFPSGQATTGSFISGQQSGYHSNVGFFTGPQLEAFHTEIQPARGQMSAEYITAAHISTSLAACSSIRAKQICATFIGQESDHQAPAGSITAGKLSADSITTGLSATGLITAGELHVGSIGPGV